jgi:hypothetical protein
MSGGDLGAEPDCANTIGSAANNKTTATASGLNAIFMRCPYPA